MAMFVFHCICGFEFDVLIPFDKSSEQKICPKCSGVAIKKAVQPTNFKLTGIGWERDGYSDKGALNNAK